MILHAARESLIHTDQNVQNLIIRLTQSTETNSHFFLNDISQFLNGSLQPVNVRRCRQQCVVMHTKDPSPEGCAEQISDPQKPPKTGGVP